jgi:hypothetical protein
VKSVELQIDQGENTMKDHLLFHLLLAVAIMISPQAHAQISAIRDPQPVGVRHLGMGEAGMAGVNDFNAIYWNPAGLSLGERYEVQFMRANLYQTGVKDNYLALMLPTLPFLHDPERLAFGFGWQNLSFGDEELDFAQHKFIFSTGYRLVKQLWLGANLKYLYRSVTSDGTETEGQGKGWGFDFGMLLSPVRGLQLGAMIHDVTDTKIRDDFTNRSDVLFYRNIRYGAAYQLKDFLLFKDPLLAIDIDDRLHLGAEIWLQNLIALRAGVQKDLYENGEDEATLSVGMGLHYKFLQFDYAYTDSPFLQNTSRFSLSLHFDPPPSPVKIRNVEAHDLYASQFIHHQQSPWLEVELSYEGDKPIDCKLTAREKKYGIKVEKSFTLYPQVGETQKVFLNPQLSDKFLKLPASERNLAQVTVSLAPKTVIATTADKFPDVEFAVYGINNIYWGNGVGPAAAFILSRASRSGRLPPWHSNGSTRNRIRLSSTATFLWPRICSISLDNTAFDTNPTLLHRARSLTRFNIPFNCCAATTSWAIAMTRRFCSPRCSSIWASARR